MTVNVERLRILRDFLINNPEKHNQYILLKAPKFRGTISSIAEIAGGCDTTGCAAGWAVLLFSPPNRWIAMDKLISVPPTFLSIADEAALLLGLDFDRATILFFDTTRVKDAQKAAISILDRLVVYPDADQHELYELIGLSDE